MAAASAITYERGSEMFRGLFSEVWQVTATLDAGSLTTGTEETETVAVPGVALGDMVLGISFGVDMADLIVTGYVQAAGAVELRVRNGTGGTVNLASTTIKLLIGRPSW